jgi:A-macroglobulin complement component/alpha-2-macroglobulin family protein/MG2 domain-containing protein/carboxypeptidase family protein/macroglobulin-like protein/A-macroglobulin receptor
VPFAEEAVMRRIWCVLLLLVSALLFAAQLSEASAALRIDESATRLLFHSDGAEALLAVHSSLRRPVTARVKLELIDEWNRSVAKVEHEVVLKPGSNIITAEFQLEPSRYVLWRRLRYQVTTVPASDAGTASGVISLSQICPDIFQLSFVKPGITPAGARCHVRARAEHPVTLRPIEGVSLSCELVFEGLPSHLQSSGRTDSEGYAEFNFDLPPVVKSDGEIKLTGTRNGLSAHVEGGVGIDRTIRISISTDKNIYQPGQTLHVRALAVDPSKRALGGAELTIKILDPEDTVVHRASLKTSRFGIASDDWAVPANIRLGDYEIKIDRDESDEEYVYTPAYKVRISRYELPNFTVTVKPDRGFYLPGQNAEVEVRGDYLFGQPVTRARVRVVRETDRQWSYREQKWETKEEEKYEGELDQSRRFVAKVDLSKQHDGLSEHDYERFKDISYAAYITDLTTNRTEQRRFDLRVTREAIHVYVIDDGNEVPGEPVNLFVSSSYADGTPAECEVEISQDLSTEAGGVRIDRSRRIRTVKTNRYGVARAAGIVITGTEEKSSALRRFELDFAARDQEGRQGHTSQTVWCCAHNVVRVETNKTLYKPGEPIEVQVTATGHASTLFIDIAQHWKILHSQTISLINGRGRLTLPYRKEFTDEVSITGYGYIGSHDFTIGTRTVLFPRRHDLKLDVNMNQRQYRPGEQASVAFRVQTGSGEATESALGVTVIDRAVEERARTDAEFGGRYDFGRAFQRLWGREEEIAGITLKSLEALDLSKPIPADLQLAAEILLLRRGYWVDQDGPAIGNPQSQFEHILTNQLRPVKSALDSRYARKKQYPTNATMLTRELADFGLDFPRMLDPWGVPYILRFSVSRDRDILRLMSAGPDKRAGTRDDFMVAEMSWPYFRAIGEAIDRAVQRHHDRTASFIRNRESLKYELLSDAINIDMLRDRWGKPYRFEFGVSGNCFTVEVKSGGSDRRFEENGNPSADDFTLWTSKIDYFAGPRAKIDAALASYFRETNRFPQQESELKEALSRSSIDWEDLRDGWGNRYYATFRDESRYSDRIRMISFAQYPGENRQRTEITPVTQRMNFIYLRSGGEDGKEGTGDDFEAASYSRVVAEQAAKDPVAEPPSTSAHFSGATGAISGKVVDAFGAAIPRAKLKAINKSSGQIFEAGAGEDGGFLFANLSAGLYEVQIDAPGFKSTIVVDVPVNSSTVTELNVTLEVGVVSETVTVTAGAEEIQTQSSSCSAVTRSATISLATVKQLTQTSTPHLREYFPETLVWQPSLETDAGGLARLNFKLADNITTWKMSVIASTEDGEIGTAEKEILAFQPFFLEHDPPRVLTEGDELALPIVLRNYLDKSQSVELEIKPELWFSVLGPARKRSEIPAGDSARETFDIRAVASVDDGKQRVTASGSEASDAVEKPVTVHPHGQELTQTATQVFSDSGSIAFAVSEAAIPGSTRAELKIYPNVMAHVIESIEGIMKRPYGCAEQTISSAYPSLLLLRYFKSKGEQPSALAQKARRYVEAGYERLLNYSDADGGFTYWGRGDGDPALTAYALGFLSDARDVTAIDEDVIKKARNWLIRHQRPDGSWPARFTTDADRLPAALRTAFIARVLASSSKNDDEALHTAAALRRALNLLRQRMEEIDEPYLIASYALAAMHAGEKDGAARAIEKLRSLVHNAHDGGDASYWKLETNTPFYGWGIAGRIEATALAVRALAAFDEGGARLSQPGSAASHSSIELVNRGLLFLLRQKDREGCWHSTQATVNVLDSLMTALGKSEPDSASSDSPAEVFINDKRAATILMPPAGRFSEPILTDISRFLSAGSNRIQIRRRAGSSQASAQVVESHYEAWPVINDAAKADSASAGALRLQVSFDKSEAKVGDEITCTVKAERVGFRGYGMLLAEIGLPPGADVDRASLDRAVKESGWGVDQYDVLPDRLIVYLWPEAGGTRFQFKLRPRLGLVAHTAPSVVYDYYNPEARAVVAPIKFIVR